ncbi:MAG: nicotinate (nicotinamide) nucleotide adenylyltransferase [Endomicrobiaceae bacterium]
MIKSKIGVLGGSFDPVHCAHLEAAFQSVSEFGLDLVVFVPAYLPPHKIKLEVSGIHRYRMLALAVGNRKKFVIDDFEINSKRKVYSYETLDYLNRKYAGNKIKLIIGSDSFNQLASWERPEYIAERYGFIVIQRPGSQPDVESVYYKYADISKFKAHDISSTAVREILKKNGDIKGKLPGKVLDYIKKNELYKK